LFSNPQGDEARASRYRHLPNDDEAQIPLPVTVDRSPEGTVTGSPHFIMMTLPARSQTGGDNTYEYLNLSHSAFVNATGGITVSSSRSDLSLPYYNPSLLNATMHNDISLSFSTWVAGITYGYASWAHHTETAGTFAGGISFISYGSFTEADAAGNITGSFSAGEYALKLSGHGRLTPPSLSAPT
jgi:hypothetical protein